MHIALTTTGRLLLTTLGLGSLRPAPGTWGSLPPIALIAALMFLGLGPNDSTIGLIISTVLLLGLILVFSAACVRYGDAAEIAFGKKDPGSVCADETAGMALTLLLVPGSRHHPAEMLAWLIGAFVLFRLLDIIKPWPAGRLQRVPGGWGILLDDLAAGLMGFLLIQIARLIL